APGAGADDVTDQINEALKAYEAKDFATAAAALGAAQDLLRQQAADAWKSYLPDPLPGWTADEASSVSAASSLLGGGTNVSRAYHRGGDTVTIELFTDSPVMQGLGKLISSGLVTGTDNKLLIINGRKVTYTRSDNSFQTMAGDKVLVAVKGSPGVDEKALKDYLAAIRWKDIEKAGPR
ncbi:MAG TPA: hypothetical protein VF502_05335, partial [Stellaceae bacterium]